MYFVWRIIIIWSFHSLRTTWFDWFHINPNRQKLVCHDKNRFFLCSSDLLTYLHFPRLVNIPFIFPPNACSTPAKQTEHDLLQCCMCDIHQNGQCETPLFHMKCHKFFSLFMHYCWPISGALNTFFAIMFLSFGQMHKYKPNLFNCWSFFNCFVLFTRTTEFLSIE